MSTFESVTGDYKLPTMILIARIPRDYAKTHSLDSKVVGCTPSWLDLIGAVPSAYRMHSLTPVTSHRESQDKYCINDLGDPMCIKQHH